MKTAINFVFCILATITLQSQSPIGAWESLSKDETGQNIRIVVIFTEGYQVASTYNADNGEFISTNGGSWSMDGNQMTETVEFDSKTPDRVGSSISFEVNLSEDKMSIVGQDMTLTRIDDGTPGALKGPWLMSGRKRNGEIQSRDTNRPRKTMKILSGTRFQWIAYNTETKQFMGTGGGTYTTKDGVYVENIEFFSRDNSRVGAKLDFKYELVDSAWHHSGKSSKGQPIYEIWSIRK